MVVCPLCTQEASPRFARASAEITPGGTKFHYAYCANCQFVFCTPLPTDNELAQYYATHFDYAWYARRMQLKQWQAWHRWQRISKRVEKTVGERGTLLDIGCGHGWFMQAAQENGWQVTGLDLPGPALTHARAQGLDTLEGTAEQVEMSRTFDVITLWHTLEHASDPLRVLNKVRGWLSPRGVLVIAVPNLEAAGLRRRRAKWVWLQQPFVHLWHWSAKSLTKTLKRSGFQVVYTETRDTWDAQFLYDAVLNPRWEETYLARIQHLTTGAARRVGLSNPAQKGEDVFFALAETSRLLTYSPYLAMGWAARRRRPNAGSELLMFAAPQKSSAA